MANCFLFLTAFIIFLAGIQKGLLAPSPESDNSELFNQLIDMVTMLKRLDQSEAKVDQHEVKINSQQIEIDQLKKKNAELSVEINQKLNLAGFLPRSCFEVKAKNPSAESGVYSINPDGHIGGEQPINVYCDMATQTTYINHDTESKTDITSCPNPGCYTKTITYSATMRQMLNLAEISASCQQYFRLDSFVVPLEYNLTHFGYWNDRNYEKQIFWAGPATSQHTCQCGIENNCIERTLKRNSDSLAPIELLDEGNTPVPHVLKANLAKLN